MMHTEKFVQHPTASGSAGFMLVAVTMFILVLTILGLSLFSLSGFESQFLTRSMQQDEAMSAAIGGIWRARFVLNSTQKLDKVDDNLPLDGVVYAVAMQDWTVDPDSIGDYDETKDILVRVRARRGAADVLLQAQFRPANTEDYYKRLFTARVINVRKTTASFQPLWSQTYLSGKTVMPSGSNQSWDAPPRPEEHLPGRGAIEVRNFVPYPDLNAFVALHRPTATMAGESGASGSKYRLDARGMPNNVGYFWSPVSGTNWNIESTHSSPEIEVGGTAVWLLDPGIRFTSKVRVTQLGLTPARLIIIARPRDHTPETQAIEFLRGMDNGIPEVPNSGVPLILITEGIAMFKSGINVYDESTTVGYLSVFAGRIDIEGPLAGAGFPPRRMQLWHQFSMLGVADPIVEALYALGVLPNAPSLNSGLTLVAGSWGPTP